MRRAWKRIAAGLFAGAVAVDMLVNGVLGGSFDETISHRLGRMAHAGSPTGIVLCAALGLLDPAHCDTALR